MGEVVEYEKPSLLKRAFNTLSFGLVDTIGNVFDTYKRGKEEQAHEQYMLHVIKRTFDYNDFDPRTDAALLENFEKTLRSGGASIDADAGLAHEMLGFYKSLPNEQKAAITPKVTGEVWQPREYGV